MQFCTLASGQSGIVINQPGEIVPTFLAGQHVCGHAMLLCEILQAVEIHVKPIKFLSLLAAILDPEAHLSCGTVMATIRLLVGEVNGICGVPHIERVAQDLAVGRKEILRVLEKGRRPAGRADQAEAIHEHQKGIKPPPGQRKYTSCHSVSDATLGHDAGEFWFQFKGGDHATARLQGKGVAPDTRTDVENTAAAAIQGELLKRAEGRRGECLRDWNGM